MKKMIAKLAARVNRMKMSIGHMFDAYEKALNELRENPVYPQLFADFKMM